MTQTTRWTIIGVVAALLLVAGLYLWLNQPAATPPRPEATPAATTAAAVATETLAPTEAAVQAESPLAQPVSPLAQPESPLTTLNGKEIVANPAYPIDRAALVNLVNNTTAPPPQEGMASVSAVLYSYGLNNAIAGTYAYLTPAEEIEGTPVPPTVFFGPRPENGDVGMETTLQGQFLLDNVPPGNYYLLVWSFADWPAAYWSPDDALPALITVAAGDRLNLGLLYVSWP